MIITIDHNLKQVDFTLFTREKGAVRLVKSVSAPMNFLEDKKALHPLIKGLLSAGTVSAAAVRLRFSGFLFDNPALVDQAFLERYASLTPYFPFYIPVTHALLCELSACLSSIPFYAFSETAFFKNLPEEEQQYAIPRGYYDNLPVRRFGYHGLYHEFLSRRMGVAGTVLSIVLDRQTTVCAVRNGRPEYISVGYTPLEGVMGRTTCGDIDPGVAFYLLRDQGQSFYWIDNLLKKESGFKGLTGFDLEIGDLYTHAGNEPAVRKAFEIYFNQILRHAGQALAVSGPFSGLVFSGRYCDALQPVIHRIAKKIGFLGAALKPLPWDMKEQMFLTVSEQNSAIPVCISRAPLPVILFELAEKTLQNRKK